MRCGWKGPIGLTAAVIVGAVLGTAPMAGAPALEERTLYVNVMGAEGPVLQGLSGGNFRVLEDGIVMEVTGLAPATAVPVSTMLLVDNTRAASSTVQDIRKAVVAYATQLLDGNPENEVGIYTFGSPAVVLQPLTSNLEDITRMANRIVANTDGSSLLNDGLVEAGNILAKVDNPRRVILMMNHEPAQEYSQVQFSEVAAAVQGSPGNAKYSTTLDRESAYEKLAARLAAGAQQAQAEAEAEEAAEEAAKEAKRAPAPAPRRREEKSMVEEVIGSSAFKQFARSAGREIVRGLFGAARRRR